MENKNSFLKVFVIIFIITWLFFIFEYKNNEFEFEFKEKQTTTAIIDNTENKQEVQELLEGREVDVYNVFNIQYSYFVKGEKYFNSQFKRTNKEKH